MFHQQIQSTGLKPAASRNPIFPKFEKPQPIGFFSLITEKRLYEPTASQLRYYRTPLLEEYPLDLNIGHNRALRKPESAYYERLDHLLRYICDNYDELFAPNPNFSGRRTLAAEFVGWRGLLRCVMCTPFETRNDWSIVVTKFMGTHYLYKKDTQDEKMRRATQSARDAVMCSWGFKMEQYCLTESPSTPPKTDEPVDECSEFACIFNTKVSGINIMYGAEMDGVMSQKKIDLQTKSQLKGLKFIEVKTRVEPSNKFQVKSFQQYKSRAWWCQCFLVGIDDIFVGMRNNNGMVHRIEHLKTSALQKQNYKCWRAAPCANFLVDFLQCIKSKMSNINCPYTTFTFTFDARLSTISYVSNMAVSEDSFLPDWYIARLRQI